MLHREYLKNVGIELKVARIRKAMTCKEVGEVAKLQTQTISKMENGTVDSKLSSYKRVADVLGIPLKDIL